MRMKWVGCGMGYDDEEVEVFLIVPINIKTSTILRNIKTNKKYNCLCECYTQESAMEIVDLWNAKYGELQ